MTRRRPWIGLAALVALAGCSMSPPSPVDEVLRGGWGSGGEEAPEPVAVPAGTPEAPRNAPVTPASVAPAPPANPAPSAVAESKPPRKADGREPLRINVPLGQLPPAQPVPEPARISSGGVALANSTNPVSPGLSVSTSPLSGPVPSRWTLEAGVSPASGGLDGAGGRIPTPGTAVPASDAPGRAPSVDSGAGALILPGASGAPVLGVAQADPTPSLASPSLRLDPPPATSMPDAPKASSIAAQVPAAATKAPSSAAGSPSIGQVPAGAAASTGAGVRAQIHVAATTLAPNAAAEVSGSTRSSAVELRSGSVSPASVAASAAIPFEPGRREASPSVLPGAAPAIAVSPAATVASPASDGAVTSATIDPDTRRSADESSRLQAERRARDEELRSHGPALRRWLQDHFPFLF